MKKDKYISTKIEPLDEKTFKIKCVSPELIISLIACLLSIFAAVMSVIAFIHILTTDIQPAKKEVKKPTEDVLVEKSGDIVEDTIAEDIPDVIELSTETVVEEPESEPTLYFDVPLDRDLQDHIFTVCEKYYIEPQLIIAMIQKESYFNSSNVGDGGNSLGLMQIQPRWHQTRANNLGCPDLMNPYHNISVGVDLFASHLKQSGSVEWALMAYNGGPSYANKMTANGRVSDYVRKVLAYSQSYKRVV